MVQTKEQNFISLIPIKTSVLSAGSSKSLQSCKQRLRDSLCPAESTVKMDQIKKEVVQKKALLLPVSWGIWKIAQNKSKWVAGPGSELL